MTVLHPRLLPLSGGRYEFIPAAHGELSYRVASDRGYFSTEMTREAAFMWAERWTSAGDRSDVFSVEVRIEGVTPWKPCIGDSSGETA